MFDVASGIYGRTELKREEDIWARVVALGLLSHTGPQDMDRVIPYFRESAASENWIERECSSGIICRLIKAYPAIRTPTGLPTELVETLLKNSVATSTF